MLRRFSVENYRGFTGRLTLDLGSPSNYTFNPGAIEGGCVSKGIIYGPIGAGRTNLGLAILDITAHLTDRELPTPRGPYLNLGSAKPEAVFEYIFNFGGHEVIYRYAKTDARTLTAESLRIDGLEVVRYNHALRRGFTRLEGSNAPTNPSECDRPLSCILHAAGSHLPDSVQNHLISELLNYAERMMYIGPPDGRCDPEAVERIIKARKIRDFQRFLRENGLCYKLRTRTVDGRKAIFCRMDEQEADFLSIASAGTLALAKFYELYLRLKDASFVFMDGTDSFYDFKVAESIQRRMIAIPGVQILTATHNTNLLSNDILRPDCYFLLKDNQIRPLSDLTAKELRRAHNLQKMFREGVFDID